MFKMVTTYQTSIYGEYYDRYCKKVVTKFWKEESPATPGYGSDLQNLDN